MCYGINSYHISSKWHVEIDMYNDEFASTSSCYQTFHGGNIQCTVELFPLPDSLKGGICRINDLYHVSISTQGRNKMIT